MPDQDRTTDPPIPRLDESNLQGLNAPLPISRLAFVSPIIGVLSGLAVFHQVLWAVPMIGTAVAILAIRRTSPPDAVYAGRRAAAVGLCLSLFFGSVAASHSFIERHFIEKHAIQFANDWITIIRSGNLPQAAEWMQSPGMRRDPDSDLPTYYQNDENARQLLDTLASSQVVKQICQLGPMDPSRSDAHATRIKFVNVDQCLRFDDMYLLTLRFQQSPDNPDALPIVCHVQRKTRQGRITWMITDLDEDPANPQ